MTNEHRRAWSRAGLVLGVGLVLMTGAACTDAEVIRLESSDTVISFQPSASSLPFSQADMDVSRLVVRPASAEGQAGSADQTTLMISSTVTIDLLTGRTVDGSPLRPGSYEVVRLLLARVPVVANPSPAAIDDPTAECWEKIALFKEGIRGVFGNLGPVEFDFAGSSAPLVFTVDSGPWEIPFLIDVDRLLLAYVEAYACNDFPGGVCSNVLPGQGLSQTAPCLVTFSFDDFEQNALPAFSSR